MPAYFLFDTVEVVEQPHPFLVLSLADLYAEEGAWDEIVDLAAGTTNEDDVTLQTRLLPGEHWPKLDLGQR